MNCNIIYVDCTIHHTMAIYLPTAVAFNTFENTTLEPNYRHI